MKIRRAWGDFEDMDFLFNLRNEEPVRMQSFNSDPVSYNNHLDWFIRLLNDKRRALYIVEVDGNFVGQVRYDILDDPSEAEVNIAISQNFGGRGYGAKALLLSATIFLMEFQGVNKVIAHIKPDNIASRKIFAKAGYGDEKEVIFKENKCIEMVLTR